MKKGKLPVGIPFVFFSFKFSNKNGLNSAGLSSQPADSAAKLCKLKVRGKGRVSLGSDNSN